MTLANALNANGTGIQKSDANGVWTTTTTTANSVLVGAASNAIANVAPSATSGVPLISQGVGVDPAFGTTVVAGGGTGVATTTAFGLIAAGTTATGAFQVVGPNATAGRVLQSAGSGALPTYSTATFPTTAGTTGKILISDGTNIISSTPSYPNTAGATGKILISDGTNIVSSTPTFPNSAGTSGNLLTSDGTNFVSSVPASFTQIVLRSITSTGTYTPTAGMKFCLVEAVGGGGGAGGAAATGAAQCSAGSGGGSGGYSKRVFTAATIGASQSVTIGAGGAGGVGVNGTVGGTTTFGAFLTCNGGNPGLRFGPALGTAETGGLGGVASGGDFNFTGNAGMSFTITLTAAGNNNVAGGGGGGSYFGGGPSAQVNTNGEAGKAPGAGGSGASLPQNQGSTRTGGAGADGSVFITEYI